MTRGLPFTAPAALLAIAACAPASTPADPPTAAPPLAQDQTQPLLALAEHVLAMQFSGASAELPTTCLAVRPAPLSAGQEEALILRFSRLAPVQRCRAQGAGHVDAITGKAAVMVQVYDLSCSDDAHCTGWAMLPGAAARRYAMTYTEGEWRFAADARILAE